MKTPEQLSQELDKEGEDLLVTLHAALLARDAYSPLSPQEVSDAARTLWETHISKTLKQKYPHREFDQKVICNAIEFALHFARESQEYPKG